MKELFLNIINKIITYLRIIIIFIGVIKSFSILIFNNKVFINCFGKGINKLIYLLTILFN